MLLICFLQFIVFISANNFDGTNLLDNLNEVRLIDTSETLGDRNARFISRFTYGIQYGFGSEIVLYT